MQHPPRDCLSASPIRERAPKVRVSDLIEPFRKRDPLNG
jgi:hypothetical protein